jgi:hypothetical protein
MATSTSADLARQGGYNVNFCDGSTLFVSTFQGTFIPSEWRTEWQERGCMPAEHRAELISLLGLATREVTADSQFDRVWEGEKLEPGELVINSGQRSFATKLDLASAASWQHQLAEEQAARDAALAAAQNPIALTFPVDDDARASGYGIDNSPPAGVAAMPTTIMPTAGHIGPGVNLSLLGDLGRFVTTVGGFIPGPAGTIINAAGQALFPGSTPSTPTGQQVLPGMGLTTCPTGYKRDSKGMCIQEGFGGTIARTLPGGNTGVLGPGGQAVVGAFGQAGILPAQVGTINGNPILRCPRAMVLGADNICYAKGSLPRQFRKWKPGTRPAVSGGDVRAIRQANSAKNRVKKLAQNVGFSVAAKGSRRACPPKKR